MRKEHNQEKIKKEERTKLEGETNEERIQLKRNTSEDRTRGRYTTRKGTQKSKEHNQKSVMFLKTKQPSFNPQL